MMTPTYEEMLKGCTTWRGDHMGVTYILSHHGHRTGDEYPGAESNPGTWCYYIIIPEQMYPHRWTDFAVTQGEYGGNQGPSWDHDWFDSEITWASSEPYWCRKTKRQWDAAKVGCDYAHLWHRERGYPDTFDSVTQDAKRTVERLLAVNSDRCLRCDYSGIWDDDDCFYEAVNGRRVHVSQESLIDPKWDGWKRKDAMREAVVAIVANLESE